ncbi:C4-type zinc ribbon domain-containing protein [bacterium]|nr:C4-type zinc ribbon domain-containing protein [bacterium]
MEEPLELLLRLQEIDVEINEIQGRRSTIPAQIEALEHEMDSARQELVDKESQLKAARLVIRETEGRVAQLDEGSNRYKQQLLAVKSNREYSALLTEIEAIKREKAELEERIISRMEQIEQLNQSLDQSRASLADQESGRREQYDSLKGQIQDLDEQIAIRRQKREGLSVRVKPRLLVLYERIMGSRVNQAVVALRNGSCGGCHAMIPLQQVNDIRKGRDIHTCENCGRILYYEENGNGA